MGYNETALAEAHTQELTSDQVEVMGFSLISELAGVDISNVPDDYFYQSVRNYLVATLRQEEEVALTADEENLLKAAMKTMPETPAGKKLKKKGVYRNDEGEIVIR